MGHPGVCDTFWYQTPKTSQSDIIYNSKHLIKTKQLKKYKKRY